MSADEDIDMLNILIVTTLAGQGFPRNAAEMVAQWVITQLQALRGGTYLYIKSIRQHREKQILRAWSNSDGSKEAIQEIASRHQVTIRTVYGTIKRARQNKKAKQPASGFGSDDWCL